MIEILMNAYAGKRLHCVYTGQIGEHSYAAILVDVTMSQVTAMVYVDGGRRMVFNREDGVCIRDGRWRLTE